MLKSKLGDEGNSALAAVQISAALICTSERKKSMKSTGIVRNIDELGRLVIPKELREKMDIPSGSAVEIYSEDDKIIIKKFYDGCMICGSSADLKELNGKKVCASCIAALAAE